MARRPGPPARRSEVRVIHACMAVSLVALAVSLATGRGGAVVVVAALVSIVSGCLYFARPRR